MGWVHRDRYVAGGPSLRYALGPREEGNGGFRLQSQMPARAACTMQTTQTGSDNIFERERERERERTS